MGDVVFRGFQCLHGDCREFIVTREDRLGPDFEIVCRACDFVHAAGGETKFFDYRLARKVRRMIREHAKIDIFEHAAHVPAHLREPEEPAA